MKLCNSCKTAIPKGEAFCPACGQPVAKNKLFFAKNGTETPKKHSKLLLFITLGFVLLVCVAGGLFFFLHTFSANGSQNAKDAPVIYTGPEGELKFALPNKKEPNLITADVTGGFVYKTSEDKRFLLYTNEAGNLYLRNVDNAKPTAEINDTHGRLVASDVYADNFAITSDNKNIVYLKNNGELYYNDLQNDNLISSGVLDFYYQGGTSIYFRTNELFDQFNNFYSSLSTFDFSMPQNGILLIDDEVSGNLSISKSGNDVYFTKIKEVIGTDVIEDVFKYAKGFAPVTLAENVILKNLDPETGDIFYLIKSDTVINTDIIVNDDKKDSDATLTDPVYDEFLASNDNDQTKTYNAYYDALLEYYQKLSRDEIRKKLKVENAFTLYNLFYKSSTGEEIALGKDIYDVYSSDFPSKSACFSTVDLENMEKLSLSEINEIYNCDLRTGINAKLKVMLNIATAKNPPQAVLSTALFDASNYVMLSHVAKNQKGIYLLTRENSADPSSTLNFVPFNDIGNPRVISTGVSRLVPNELDGNALFFTDINLSNNTATLYSTNGTERKKLVENGATDMSIQNDDTLLFYKNYDANLQSGTLFSLYKGVTTQISEEVNAYKWESKNNIYLLTSVNAETGAGKLYHYNGQDLTLIDENVSSIIYPASCLDNIKQ